MQADGTVFIVDDDEAVRDSLKLLLETHGLSVREYASCEAFMRDYRPQNRQCLVLDQHLPGMTGLELLESLDQGGATLPTILVTGRGDSTIKARAQAAGVLAYLDKPVTESRLLPLIRVALAQSQVG
jgi:FixJ family two-component response regulator